MVAEYQTLGRVLNSAQAAGALSASVAAMVLDLATACRDIGKRLSDNVLHAGDGRSSEPGAASRAAIAKFQVLNHDSAPTTAGRRDWNARMISTWQESSESMACGLQRGRYLAVLLPVDSPANLGVNGTVGTIFSILPAPEPHSPNANDVVNSRFSPLCAGYAIHGPSLILVVALAAGVHAFAYDRQKNEFVQTQANMRIPPATEDIALDAADMRLSEPALRRYLDECLAGQGGPRGRGFHFRWCGSMVTEVHRILMLGGLFIHLGPNRIAIQRRALRLLEEVVPLSFVVERAGGRASTGKMRIIDAALNETRVHEPLLFGAIDEVDRIEAYHRNPASGPNDTPLFGARGLFRPAV